MRSPIKGIGCKLRSGRSDLEGISNKTDLQLARLKGRNRSLHRQRSEEHTSELQSLMRISYAVFCLKKKTTKSTHTHHQIHNTPYYNKTNDLEQQTYITNKSDIQSY